MSEACRYCEQRQVVPVLDMAMQERSAPGNKFRRFCLSCQRWLPMCSETYFKEHPSPHILPADRDASEKAVVQLDDYEDVLSAITPETNAGVTGIQNATVQENQQTSTDRHSINSNSVGKPETSTLNARISVLNESIRAMVDCDIIDETEAYQFLSSKLSELLSDATYTELSSLGSS